MEPWWELIYPSDGIMVGPIHPRYGIMVATTHLNDETMNDPIIILSFWLVLAVS